MHEKEAAKIDASCCLAERTLHVGLPVPLHVLDGLGYHGVADDCLEGNGMKGDSYGWSEYQFSSINIQRHMPYVHYNTCSRYKK